MLKLSALTFSAALLPLPRSSPEGVGVGVGAGVVVGVGVGVGSCSFACATGESINQASVNVMRSGRIAALSRISGFIPPTKEKNPERFKKNEIFYCGTAQIAPMSEKLASPSRRFARRRESLTFTGVVHVTRLPWAPLIDSRPRSSTLSRFPVYPSRLPPDVFPRGTSRFIFRYYAEMIIPSE